MNIYDLEKKATPGPLVVCSAIDLSHCGLDVAYTRCWYNNETERNSKTVLRQPPGGPPGDKEADTVWIAHCCNHFMEALEDLKMMLDLQANNLIDFKQYGLTCDRDIEDRLRRTIAKLETVEEV